MHTTIDQFPPDIFSQETRQHGAIILHFTAVIYIFAVLIYISNSYYVPSLKAITQRFQINQNVAGATIVAIAGSAIELAISLFGTFISKSDVGLGTVVGSGSFSILLGFGLCAILASGTLETGWYPVLRDGVFYLLSLVMVAILIYKKEVRWFEALMLITCYTAYVTLVWLSQWCDKKWPCQSTESDTSKGTISNKEQTVEEDPLIPKSEEEEISQQTCEHTCPKAMLLDFLKGIHSKQEIIVKNAELNGILNQADCCDKPVENDDHEDEKAVDNKKPGDNEKPNGYFSTLKDQLKPPTEVLMLISWVFGFPAILLLALSIPRHMDTNSNSLLFLTFINSVTYIGAFSYILVWMVTVISFTLGIKDIIFGLVVLAAAGCAPDIIAAVILARHSLGDMCISSILGNSIFDVFIGLGLPWLLKALIYRSPIKIISGSITYSLMILTGCVVCLMCTLAINGFSVGKKSGVILVFAYFLSVSLTCLLELDIIGHLNVPKCQSS